MAIEILSEIKNNREHKNRVKPSLPMTSDGIFKKDNYFLEHLS